MLRFQDVASIDGGCIMRGGSFSAIFDETVERVFSMICGNWNTSSHVESQKLREG
jgi:hypothetical protein